ncbi:MAG: response regulator [Elusimicrobiota bacterium]
MALNILIVDDSSTMRKILLRNLNLCGLPIKQVFEASNGQEGLNTLNKEKIDMAFVDIHMPVMNGIEFLKNARLNPATAKVPFIFVSSESSVTQVENLLKVGICFVHKPFTPEALLEAINAVLAAIGG